MENPSKMDDLEVPLFSETPIYSEVHGGVYFLEVVYDVCFGGFNDWYICLNVNLPPFNVYASRVNQGSPTIQSTISILTCLVDVIQWQQGVHPVNQHHSKK